MESNLGGGEINTYTPYLASYIKFDNSFTDYGYLGLEWIPNNSNYKFTDDGVTFYAGNNFLTLSNNAKLTFDENEDFTVWFFFTGGASIINCAPQAYNVGSYTFGLDCGSVKYNRINHIHFTGILASYYVCLCRKNNIIRYFRDGILTSEYTDNRSLENIQWYINNDTWAHNTPVSNYKELVILKGIGLFEESYTPKRYIKMISRYLYETNNS